MYGCGVAATAMTNAAEASRIALASVESTVNYDFVPSVDELSSTIKNGHLYSSVPSNTLEEPKMMAASVNDLKKNNEVFSHASNVDDTRPYCRALYNFIGKFKNELTFSTGEIIYIQQKISDDWMEGELQSSGASGIFPVSFVEIVVDFVSSNALNIESSSNTFKPFNSPSAVGVAVVVYDFLARFEDELTVSNGDSVKIIEIIDENWVRCQNVTNGQCGIVPQTFLQIFLENDETFNTSMSPATIFKENINKKSVLPSSEIYIENEVSVPWNLDLFPISAFNQTSSETITNKSTDINPIKLHPALPMIYSFDAENVATLSKQPPRPPPPKNIPTTGLQNTSIKYNNNETELMTLVTTLKPKFVDALSLSSNSEDQKLKVVQDLLITETTYLFDLDSWQACISSSTELTDNYKRILNNGLPLLKELSQKLIDNIKLERGKTSDLQCYGQMFMEMKEHFFRSFSHYCRSVEQISQILENNIDVIVQDALNKCLIKMRNMGSKVFDVPTAMSRPIHRCLKYPLYVGELLKNTALNHIDHPKLMESLKQLGNLASKMNECKRRKELIRKYREEQQLSLTERLSRISVHSLVKKSNRFKYRISSTMGLNLIRDGEFDYLITLLYSAERKVCKFLYCAQLYKKNMELTLKKYEDNFKGNLLLSNELIVKTVSIFINQLSLIKKNFLQEHENEVIFKGKKLVHCAYTKLIHKRFDKLADYETAKATNKNASEVEMRRNEYEALNNQVKNGLPKLITTINKSVVELIHKVHELDSKLIHQINSLLVTHYQDSKRGDLFSGLQAFSEFIVNCFGNRFYEMDKGLSVKSDVNQYQDTINKDCVKNCATRRSSSLRIVNGNKIKQNYLKSHKFPVSSTSSSGYVRPQTFKERDALVKIIKAQNEGVENLRRLNANYSTMKLKLNEGDIVIVKDHKNDKFLCDNGVSLDYVPIRYLNLFVELAGEDTFNPLNVDGPNNSASCLKQSQQLRPFSLPTFSISEESKSVKNKNNTFDEFDVLFSTISDKRDETHKANLKSATKLLMENSLSNAKKNEKLDNLIDLEDNLIDFNSPKMNKGSNSFSSDKFCLVQYDKEPVRKGNVWVNFNDMHTKSTELLSVSKSAQNLNLPNISLLKTDSNALTTADNNKNDVFAELFHLAINMPLSKVHKEQNSLKKEISKSPAPEIPTRPEAGETNLKADLLSDLHLPIVPVKTAPLPPLPAPIFESQEQKDKNATMKCGYDFNPVISTNQASCQIALHEGELVTVLQRHDDVGNSEWWMVRQLSFEKKTGYVPATYLFFL